MNKSHLILRGVVNDSQKRCALPNGIKVKQVWTLINEELYHKIGLQHNMSAFLEDRMHDWMITKDNELRFYGHSGATGEQHDLVLVLDDVNK